MMEFTAQVGPIVDNEGGTKVTLYVSEPDRQTVMGLAEYRGRNLSIRVKVMSEEGFGRKA